MDLAIVVGVIATVVLAGAYAARPPSDESSPSSPRASAAGPGCGTAAAIAGLALALTVGTALLLLWIMVPHKTVPPPPRAPTNTPAATPRPPAGS